MQRFLEQWRKVHTGDDVHDTDLQMHALAALQKLSLRRSAQEALVKANMVPWTIEFLRRHETLSEHAVEYSLSTLMNVCLCRAGRCAFSCGSFTPMSQLVPACHSLYAAMLARHEHLQ